MMAKKACTICKEEKNLTEFYYMPSRSRYHSQCRVCQREYSKIYGNSNKDKRNARREKWNMANKDKCLLHWAIWRKENPEWVKAYARKRNKIDVYEVSDRYTIKYLLRYLKELSSKDIREYPKLMELARIKIRLDRLIKIKRNQ